VHNRKLLGEAWPVLGGLTLRLFDTDSRAWRLWWTSTRQPRRLDPPLEGRFAGRSALFEGEDVLAGRPVRVQFRWQSQDPRRWQQDLSFDGGSTWRSTWTMTFACAR